MVSLTTLLTATLGLAATASAHMKLTVPVALGDPANPNVSNIDHQLVNPLAPGQFPCRGYHLDPSRGAYAPTDTVRAGFPAWFRLDGSALHGGGSCQISLSYDHGATFKVIASWIGNCPSDSPSAFLFDVPADAPSGNAIFAWTWFNKIGNRSMYMGCAAVEVINGGAGLGAYPDVFVADVGNGCTTTENYPVEFPNPGNQVFRSGEQSRPPIC